MYGAFCFSFTVFFHTYTIWPIVTERSPVSEKSVV
jgi:hypothetical protein